MKLWEMYKRAELERLETERRAVLSRWKVFAETGACSGIKCGRCPFDGTCRDGHPSYDERMDRLNEEAGV